MKIDCNSCSVDRECILPKWTLHICNNSYSLSDLVSCWSLALIRRIIYKVLNACHFDYMSFAVSGKVGIP